MSPPPSRLGDPAASKTRRAPPGQATSSLRTTPHCHAASPATDAIVRLVQDAEHEAGVSGEDGERPAKRGAAAYETLDGLHALAVRISLTGLPVSLVDRPSVSLSRFPVLSRWRPLSCFGDPNHLRARLAVVIPASAAASSLR